jgi:hypothetical protein
MLRIAIFILSCLALLGCSGGEVIFNDIESQTAQFMAWESDIALTPAQEAVKKAALEAIPAPCCSDNTAYTCCCPCNVSRTIWGLSNHLIAKQGFTALQVREKVEEWIEFVSPDGFEGRACYTGGCPRPFAEGGCGGMNPAQVNF